MIVQCPYCHYKEAVPEEYAGMIGECSNCGKDFKITGPRALEPAKSEGEHPVICFVLGFFFSLIGILVAYIIDKKNVVKAVIGFFCSLLCGAMVGIVACCSVSSQKKSMDVMSVMQKIQGAAESYYICNGECPKDASVLVGSSNYLKSNDEITDPWGTRCRIELNGTYIVIISAGPDKRFGTSDDIRSYRF